MKLLHSLACGEGRIASPGTAQRWPLAAAILCLGIGLGAAGALRPALAEEALPDAEGATLSLHTLTAQIEEVPGALPEPAALPGPSEEAYPLTLQESIERALGRNLDIAVGRLQPEISGADVLLEESRFDASFNFVSNAREDNQLQSSTLGGGLVVSSETLFLESSFTDPLPTGGSYTLLFRNSRFDTDDDFVFFDPSYRSSWEFSFSQPLLKNFGLEANQTQLTVARNNQEISRSDFRQTVMDVVADVEKAYWDLAYRILDLDVKRQSLDLAQDLLRLNRTKVQVGTLAPIEITQAEAGVADREEGVILAQNEIRNAEDQLKQLLGTPDDPLWLYTLEPVDEPPFSESLPDLEQSLGQAFSVRPDLASARLTRHTREAEFSQARNQRRLDLTFDGSYGANGLGGDEFRCVDPLGNFVSVFQRSQCTAPNQLVAINSTDLADSAAQARDRDADSWQVGLTLRVPVGNRDAESRYIATRLALEQADIDLKRVEQTATLEVRRAVRDIETGIKRVKVARVNSRLQREKLEAEQKKFENGISTSFNVLEFQEDLAQARSREIQALVDYNKARVELERVMGTLPEARDITMSL